MCTLSAAELESLLSSIRDLLPDLGEGFLLACLEQYGYDSELVINNILEDRLDPQLDRLDRTLPRYTLHTLLTHSAHSTQTAAPAVRRFGESPLDMRWFLGGY